MRAMAKSERRDPDEVVEMLRLNQASDPSKVEVS
jgi:hypothetical protein